MSQSVSMTVLSAEEFALVQTDPQAVPLGRERFDLHPLWYNFHELFRTEPGSLRFIIQGDLAEHAIEWCLGLQEGQAEEEGDGVYFAYVKPETVAEINATLQNWPRWKVFDRLRKAHPGWLRHKKGRDDFGAAFDQLVEIYSVAGKRGAALQILVC